MNARQRRGSLLLVVSVLLALVAFVGVFAVIRDVESKVGPETTAFEVDAEIEPYQALEPGQFREVRLPERYVPESAITDLDDLDGKVAVAPLEPGSLLQSDMIAEQPELGEGQQEIAIMIDASTGVAGKIYPGATINLYAAYTVQEGSGNDEEQIDVVRLMVNNAEVIDVGDLTEVEEDRERVEAVPITFALDHLDAQRITFAEAFAHQIRLALVAPGDEQEIPESERTYTLIGDILTAPHTDLAQLFQD